MSDSRRLSFRAGPDDVGVRLDKVLARHEEVGTRTRASHLIDKGLVTVGGKPARASLLLKDGDEVAFELPPAQSSELQPLHMKLDVLFEDEDVIVLDKPAGLVVHPAAGHEQDTLVNALLAHTKDLSMKFGEERPGIVHRLDKETSGLLVVAKNDFAHENLTQQFKERSTHRLYEAVVYGALPKDSLTVKSYLARHPTMRKKYASLLGTDRKFLPIISPPPESGKWSITHARTLSEAHGLSLLEVKLETGRTHQIRAHMSESGHPLVGDELYGSNAKVKAVASSSIRGEIAALDRFLLHAKELAFTHPKHGTRMEFRRDWPAADLETLKKWDLRK